MGINMTDLQIGMLLGMAVSLIGGCVFFGVAVWLVRLGRQMSVGCTEQVYGFVVRNELETFHSSDPASRKVHKAYRPVVRFRLQDGSWLERKHTVGVYPAKYSEGEHILIKYDPKDPGHFVLPRDTDVEWFPVVILAVFGIAAIGMAVVFGYMLFTGAS